MAKAPLSKRQTVTKTSGIFPCYLPAFSHIHGIADNEKLTMEFRQNVYLIFKEAINNVVKHAGANRVQVDIQKENGYFIMQIKDDGIGLKEKKFNNGHGLYNTQLRIGRLKAAFDITSDKGVTIQLKVPLWVTIKPETWIQIIHKGGSVITYKCCAITAGLIAWCEVVYTAFLSFTTMTCGD